MLVQRQLGEHRVARAAQTQQQDVGVVAATIVIEPNKLLVSAAVGLESTTFALALRLRPEGTSFAVRNFCVLLSLKSPFFQPVGPHEVFTKRLITRKTLELSPVVVRPINISSHQPHNLLPKS